MVYYCDMDANSSSNSNDGPARSSSAEPVGISSGPLPVLANSTTTNSASHTGSNNISANCGGGSSARQSPKVMCGVPTPTLAVAALHRNSTSPSMPRKIMSKNHNNTTFPTTYPSNLAELQLFRVMQNASLLVYYDTLLEMGGDDVQQLCDAGEEEFLEIMSLVGMASKPLHVRRLQKSLQEWVTNGSKFRVPLVPGEDFEIELSSPRVTSNYSSFYPSSGIGSGGGGGGESDNSRNIYSPSSGDVCALPPITSPGLSLSKSSSPGSSMSVQLTPSLVDSQINKLAASAERLSKHLPQFEPKPHNTKKKVCKELELVMSMPENDPRRMDEIRRYAAIYGRFDCKRKPEKPLTLHEVSVNEAAAQICRFIPALLTRRDELFPLARQVVKDSGCYYSKTQLSSMYMSKNVGPSSERDICRMMSTSSNSNDVMDTTLHASKKAKVDHSSDSGGDVDQRQENLSTDPDAIIMRSSLHSLFHHTGRNSTTTRRTSLALDFDDADSNFSYSNSSSPLQVSGGQDHDSYSNHHHHISKMHSSNSGKVSKNNKNNGTMSSEEIELLSPDEDPSKFSPKVQIIAASGDNIIAVANPALAMSSVGIPSLVTESRESNRNISKD